MFHAAHDKDDAPLAQPVNRKQASQPTRKQPSRAKKGQAAKDDDNHYLPASRLQKKRKADEDPSAPAAKRPVASSSNPQKALRNFINKAPLPIRVQNDKVSSHTRHEDHKPNADHIVCNYTRPDGSTCEKKMRADSFKRHDKTHLVAEARTYNHYRKDCPNLDVIDMYLICKATVAKLKSKSAVDKTPHTTPAVIPDNVKQGLCAALKSKDWKPSALEGNDLIQFKHLATYLSQWFAYEVWTCVASKSHPKAIPKSWARDDLFSDRHALPMTNKGLSLGECANTRVLMKSEVEKLQLEPLQVEEGYGA